jgi:hypothetical protein
MLMSYGMEPGEEGEEEELEIYLNPNFENDDFANISAIANNPQISTLSLEFSAFLPKESTRGL